MVRSRKHGSINSGLLEYHNNEWLLHKRSQWVASRGDNSSRVSALAGRTGTRLNLGHPQPRWEEGVALAREVLVTSDKSIKGGLSLGIGTRIRNAVSTLHELFNSQLNAGNE